MLWEHGSSPRRPTLGGFFPGLRLGRLCVLAHQREQLGWLMKDGRDPAPAASTLPGPAASSVVQGCPGRGVDQGLQCPQPPDSDLGADEGMCPTPRAEWGLVLP